MNISTLRNGYLASITGSYLSELAINLTRNNINQKNILKDKKNILLFWGMLYFKLLCICRTTLSHRKTDQTNNITLAKLPILY